MCQSGVSSRSWLPRGNGTSAPQYLPTRLSTNGGLNPLTSGHQRARSDAVGVGSSGRQKAEVWRRESEQTSLDIVLPPDGASLAALPGIADGLSSGNPCLRKGIPMWSRNLPVFSSGLLLVLGCLVLGCGGGGGGSSPTAPQATCFDRAVFGQSSNSAFTLPFQVGEGYLVSQSYCFSAGGHRDQLAYDFSMPIGVVIVAARAGVVKKIRQDLPDDGVAANSSIHNHIDIEHPNGTVAFYAHLKQNSVVVAVDEQVKRGQVIALSGNSGNTGGLPHLHFGVYQAWPPTEGLDVPVNFRNADGPLDERGGLIAQQTYTALPY